MKSNLILILSICLMYSCNNEEPECGDPGRFDCIIELVDNTGNNMIGTDKAFHPDSVYFVINDYKWTTYIASGQIIWSYTALDQYNETDYILHLSSSEADTVNMIIDRKPGRCYDSFAIDSFLYNGFVILPYINENTLEPTFTIIVAKTPDTERSVLF